MLLIIHQGQSGGQNHTHRGATVGDGLGQHWKVKGKKQVWHLSGGFEVTLASGLHILTGLPSQAWSPGTSPIRTPYLSLSSQAKVTFGAGMASFFRLEGFLQHGLCLLFRVELLGRE